MIRKVVNIMEKIWEITIIVVPTICSALCTFLTVRAENKVNRKDNIEKAMMFLLRGELRELYNRCMEAGKISDYDLGSFEEMYDVYHSLGWNSVGTVWKNDLEKLERSQ